MLELPREDGSYELEPIEWNSEEGKSRMEINSSRLACLWAKLWYITNYLQQASVPISALMKWPSEPAFVFRKSFVLALGHYD